MAEASNKEKKAEIEYNGKRYIRIPVKTHVIMSEDRIVDVV